ncbi:MAG: hypothetical protein ACE361_22045 [Aureliella sp.]
MQFRVKDLLTDVRIRQQFSRGFQWAAIALLVSATIGAGILLLQRAGVIEENAIAAILVFASTMLGLAVGMLVPTSWRSTAEIVDQHYGLKDRSLTAFDFAARSKLDELQMLQVEDALEHLDRVDASEVVPYRIPRFAPAAICTLAVMLAIALVPTQSSEAVASAPEPMPVVLEQASLLEETMLEELDELAQEVNDDELKDLVEELEEAIEDLKSPEVDQREALAKLSEMQIAVAEAMKQMDVEQIDAQLEQLAQAMEAAEATEAASQALKSQQYDKAAEELEKIDASTMSRKEREAVKSNMSKLAKKLGEANKGELSDAIAEMVEGLENENNSKCKSGMCKAAGVCKKQGMKKKISQCLGCQLNRLSECKSCCQGSCNKPGSKVAKTKSPSNKWGTGASNQPTGENKTKLDSTRREENITGMAGDGPSEKETLSSPEARQDAQRAYRDRYTEFRKQMEEVLDSEPLPLGHRQTVRTYFENIRPQNGDEVFSSDSE